jgi:hypothetical protein
VKNRGYSNDEHEQTAYDQLLFGAGDTCVEDAVMVVDTAWPGYINPRARQRLGIA